MPSLRQGLLQGLRRLVPIDAAFFASADPDTLLFTSAWAEEPLLRVGPQFLAHEYAETEDKNRFAALARAARPVATLDQATRGDRTSSARFREVLAPLGLGDEVRVALRVGTATWGFLCLHREGATSFSSHEIAVLQQVASHGGEAIRRIVAASATITPQVSGLTGVIVVADARVVAVTEAAAAWLEELDGIQVRPGDPAPLSLLAAVRRLEALERGADSTSPAALKLVTRRGSLLHVHAAWLQGVGASGAIAITLASADASARSVMLLAAHGLTQAQRRVAALVLRGQSTKEISTELHIGEHTVQDHLKAVFEKLGVGSRRELVAALHHR